MSDLTKTEPAVKSNGQDTANETNKQNSSSNNQIIERGDYKGIQTVGLEQGWFAAMGQKRLTLYYPTKEALHKYLDEKPYELMVVIAAAVTEEVIQMVKG